MKTRHFFLAIAAIILTALIWFFFQAPKQWGPSRIEGERKTNASRGNVELQSSSLSEAVAPDAKTDQSRVVSLASPPTLETKPSRNSSGVSIVGSGETTRIVKANGEVVFRPGSGRSLGGMEINATGSLAKLSFGESPFIEIVSLASFDKIAVIGIEKSPSDVEWRWLSDRILIGIKNSSAGEGHNEQAIKRKSELYVFNVDLNRVEGPMTLPSNLPPHFEVAEVGPNAAVQLLAQEGKDVREVWVVIKPSGE